MDWDAILRGCKERALALGLSPADADDVASEAVLRTLEAMPEHTARHARVTVERLSADLLAGRSRRGLVARQVVHAVDPERVGESIEAEAQLDARRELEGLRPQWVRSALDADGSTQRMARKRLRQGCR